MSEVPEELTFVMQLSKFKFGLDGAVYFKIILSPFSEIIFLN